MLVSSCSFLIPENPSTARYNKVVGERRMPQENMKMRGLSGPQSSVAAPVAPVAQAPLATPEPVMEPVTPMAPAPAPIASMDLPPVDPMTQRLAAERLAAEGRSMPSENIQLASGDYPQLNQIPPAPPRSGPESDAERLNAVRQQLERDRINASGTTQQVRDAAAREPSMLGPNGTVPAPEPIMSAPAPAPQSFNTPVSVPTEVRGSIATLPPPPPPLVAAPAPRVASAPAPIQMDAIPMRAVVAPTSVATAAMEPIMLRPPVVATPAPAFVPTPAPTAPAFHSLPPAAGSFDPMAGSGTSYASSSSGYLPASRYQR